MTIVSSFEIIAESLVPNLPSPLPSNPFALQGYWLQITNTVSVAAKVSIEFTETTGFASEFYTPFAQYIDGAGNVNIVDDFLSNGRGGFVDILIPSQKTFIFGVQAFKKKRPPDVAASDPIKQAGVGWRGSVVSSSNVSSGPFVISATHRLAYFEDSSLKKFINGCVYPVPFYSS